MNIYLLNILLSSFVFTGYYIIKKYFLFRIYRLIEEMDKEETLLNSSNSLIYSTDDLKYVPHDVLKHFECPISLTYFVDPVISKYGNTFERKEIVNWLKMKSECPLTRQPLTIYDIRDNNNLRYAMEFFIEFGRQNRDKF